MSVSGFIVVLDVRSGFMPLQCTKGYLTGTLYRPDNFHLILTIGPQAVALVQKSVINRCSRSSERVSPFEKHRCELLRASIIRAGRGTYSKLFITHVWDVSHIM